jgi:hypothetical protein
MYVARVVAILLLAGCGSVSVSSAWQAHCPPGNYASQSLDEWFRPSWDVTQGPHGPQVEGYIHNKFGAARNRCSWLSSGSTRLGWPWAA